MWRRDATEDRECRMGGRGLVKREKQGMGRAWRGGSRGEEGWKRSMGRNGGHRDSGDDVIITSEIEARSVSGCGGSAWTKEASREAGVESSSGN